MAASTTLREERIGVLKKITWVWTAHTDGVVALATPNAITTHPYNGIIERLVTIPDTGTAPSPDYDVYVKDEDGADVLMGGGLNRHTSNTEQVLASSLGVVANDKLNLYISGAGSGGKGTVHLYIR